MGKINIEVCEIESKDGVKQFAAQTNMEASIYEAMLGIAITLYDIEKSLPDEDRQQFRSDFLQLLNNTRNGEYYA